MQPTLVVLPYYRALPYQGAVRRIFFTPRAAHNACYGAVLAEAANSLIADSGLQGEACFYTALGGISGPTGAKGSDRIRPNPAESLDSDDEDLVNRSIRPL